MRPYSNQNIDETSFIRPNIVNGKKVYKPKMYLVKKSTRTKFLLKNEV